MEYSLEQQHRRIHQNMRQKFSNIAESSTVNLFGGLGISPQTSKEIHDTLLPTPSDAAYQAAETLRNGSIPDELQELGASPIEVVVLPSPAVVGVMADTSINLPRRP